MTGSLPEHTALRDAQQVQLNDEAERRALGYMDLALYLPRARSSDLLGGAHLYHFAS